MQINIQLRDLILFAFVLGFFFFPRGVEKKEEGFVGGPVPEQVLAQEAVVSAAMPTQRSSEETAALLARKKEILELQLKELAGEADVADREVAAIRRVLVLADKAGDMAHRSSLEKELNVLLDRTQDLTDARERLLALRGDQPRYERELVQSYEEVSPPKPRFFTPRVLQEPRLLKSDAALSWPVPPLEGISAGYMDRDYRKNFGMNHYAIDIPTPQGTDIQAPADGVVTEVSDRGYGYSTVTLDHENGLVTVFGHVSEIHVRAGQHVSRGEVIALSGGRPGSKGSGLLTTGPHLHFEVHAYGLPIDPLYKLPPLSQAIASAKASVMPAM